MAVERAKPAHGVIATSIAVGDPLGRFFWGAGHHIDAKERFGAQQPAELEVLSGADIVVLQAAQNTLSRGRRSDRDPTPSRQ